MALACHGTRATSEAGASPSSMGPQTPASYRGTLPCPGCADARAQLDLWPDGTFHLDRSDAAGVDGSLDEIGRWRRDPDAAEILLYGGHEAPLRMQIVDSRTLRALDAAGTACRAGRAGSTCRPTGQLVPADAYAAAARHVHVPGRRAAFRGVPHRPLVSGRAGAGLSRARKGVSGSAETRAWVAGARELRRRDRAAAANGRLWYRADGDRAPADRALAGPDLRACDEPCEPGQPVLASRSAARRTRCPDRTVARATYSSSCEAIRVATWPMPAVDGIQAPIA